MLPSDFEYGAERRATENVNNSGQLRLMTLIRRHTKFHCVLTFVPALRFD